MHRATLWTNKLQPIDCSCDVANLVLNVTPTRTRSGMEGRSRPSGLRGQRRRAAASGTLLESALRTLTFREFAGVSHSRRAASNLWRSN